MKFLWFMITVCSIVCFGCNDSGRNIPDGSPTTLSTKSNKTDWATSELVQLICSIRPWSSEKSYNDSDWVRTIKIARILQSVDTAQTADAMEQFTIHISKSFHPDSMEESKAFLLLRVMFDLPESHPGKGHFVKGWLTENQDTNPDGSLNLGWPITWKVGKPSFVSKYMGYEGFSYNPKQDYLQLHERFKLRDLSAWETESSVPHKR
jgi:hypothetical protein